MRLVSTLVALVALCSLPGVLAAQDAQSSAAQTPAPKPCTAEEYRQFDFWLGTWEVKNKLRPDGPASTNRITVEEDGCVVFERYTTPSGYTGRSLSFYDAVRKRWHQTWIDNQGQPLYLDGTFQDGALVLSGEAPGVKHRVTWRPLDGGKVQQLWESSKDGGSTWSTVFDGLYSPQG